MEKMLVTQGLNELKTLNARIEREIENSAFVTAAKTCEKSVNPSMTKEKFEQKAKASMQSIRDLMDRRAKIKGAIVESNAKTLVEICGEKMTVAKAIDLKSFIDTRKMLLSEMKSQLTTANSLMTRKNSEMEKKMDDLVAAAFGKESKTNIKEDDYTSITGPYRKNNEYSLVDPLNIADTIEAEEKYIEEFLANVDQVLQVSNCITTIEF